RGPDRARRRADGDLPMAAWAGRPRATAADRRAGSGAGRGPPGPCRGRAGDRHADARSPHAHRAHRRHRRVAPLFPNGFEVTLNTYGGSVVSVDQVSQAVQGYLARVGVRARIKHFEDVGQYLAQLRAGKLDGLILQSWGNNSVFDADALYYFFFSGSISW